MPEEEIPKLEGIEENVIEILNELVNGEKGRGDKLGLRKTVLEVLQGSTEANPYLYAGYRFDRKIGLYYLQARYYDPVQGRFISRDRWVGEQATPLTQNKYIYAVNSPANFIDPTGEKFSFSKVASRAKSAVSKVRNVVKSVSGISKSKTSKGVSKAKSAANRAAAKVKKTAKSLKDRINNTVKLLVSTSRNNTSKPSTYVNNNRQSGSRLVNSLNKTGGLKISNNIVAKAPQLFRKTYEAVKGLSQSNKFVDRYSAGSKLAPILGSKLINSKNTWNIGFGSNVKPPTPGISNLLGRKASYGQARVEVKKEKEVKKLSPPGVLVASNGSNAFLLNPGNTSTMAEVTNTKGIIFANEQANALRAAARYRMSNNSGVGIFALGPKWHTDYNKKVNPDQKFIHKDDYRFNKAGELVDHDGKVIGEPKGKAAKVLRYLKNVKPNFFRTPFIIIIPPGWSPSGLYPDYTT